MKIVSNKPKLNPTQLYLVARALDSSMKEFYEIPENVAKFEKWKLEKAQNKQRQTIKKIKKGERKE